MKMLALAMAAAAITAPSLAADRMVPAARIRWTVEAPGQPQRLGKLWGDRSAGPAGTYLKTPGNWNAPVHTHTADYRAVVVQGVWKHWAEGGSKAAAPALRPGSYWTQAARQWHADACVSPTPCIILLVNSAPYRTIVKGGR